MMGKVIIFTDLDGTLLHPKTYSFQEALPALELVRKRGIPVIFCSSKTRAEIEVWRERLENHHPFVSENGGAIFLPKGYFKRSTIAASLKNKEENKKYNMVVLGKPYSEIRKAFIEMREKRTTKAKGFGDMDAREVAALAGLTIEEAVLAKKREFDEPFIFEEKADVTFLKASEEYGLHWTQGRFFHLMGDNDKGKAVNILKEFYTQEFGPLIAIGLGDSLNDLSLLEEVDLPCLVKRGNGLYEPKIFLPNLRRTKEIGPAGWNEAILTFLKNQETI